ncbi:MAG: HAMP domain-containing histidine kinase [Clostridiaceae bacterium]|nr:HAMP domain-containing histidine kinase [Clostridiaceae bacterium]
MGTKSKRSRAFLVWLCFFLGVNILLGLAALGWEYRNDIRNESGDILPVILGDFKDTSIFKKDMGERFEYLMRYVSGTGYMESYVSTFSDEGENLLYYAENLNTGKTVGNIEKEKVIAQESAGSHDGGDYQSWEKVILQPGYDYYLYYNGSSVLAQNRNRTVNVYNHSSGYRDTWLDPYLYKSEPYPHIRILLMVKKDITENPYAYSWLYYIRQQFDQARWRCLGIIGVIVLDLALFIIALVKRKDKREFDRTLARISGKLWIEVKVVISILVLSSCSVIIGAYGYYEINWIPYILALWWFYVMLVDLLTHRMRFFTHNSITWLIGRYRAFESKKPFQKALLWRIHALIAAEIVLVIIAFFFAAAGTRTASIAIPFVLAGLYLIWLYLRQFRKTVNELGMVVDRIEAMKNGKYEAASSLPADSDFYKTWNNLARIQGGIQQAVEEKLRSERMKMELITNVSHDLKTPLTSIISYTDLIAREEGLPDNVKEYVQILSQKADRLKTLIQDLFELSKAASGDMVLDLERIDLARLLEQTLADMDEQIQESGLTFKVNVPGSPVYIMSDGRRLYRVFQNLISNALKYSMKSSRVYVNLIPGSRAKVEIKNVANYEMDFDADEIMERFVRGDKARSTEGSGLGLAIARSFTLACGGSFNISIDGDLFKVTLAFNTLTDDEDEADQGEADQGDGSAGSDQGDGSAGLTTSDQEDGSTGPILDDSQVDD